MNFGQALELVKAGNRVRRAGWNGKGMFIFLQRGSVNAVCGDREPLIAGVSQALFEFSYDLKTFLPFLRMRAADGCIVNGWLASQTDMLAEDWELVS